MRIPSAVAVDDGTSGRRSQAPDLRSTTVTQETTVNPAPMNTDETDLPPNGSGTALQKRRGVLPYGQLGDG